MINTYRSLRGSLKGVLAWQYLGGGSNCIGDSVLDIYVNIIVPVIVEFFHNVIRNTG